MLTLMSFLNVSYMKMSAIRTSNISSVNRLTKRMRKDPSNATVMTDMIHIHIPIQKRVAKYGNPLETQNCYKRSRIDKIETVIKKRRRQPYRQLLQILITLRRHRQQVEVALKRAPSSPHRSNNLIPFPTRP